MLNTQKIQELEAELELQRSRNRDLEKSALEVKNHFEKLQTKMALQVESCQSQISSRKSRLLCGN